MVGLIDLFGFEINKNNRITKHNNNYNYYVFKDRINKYNNKFDRIIFNEFRIFKNKFVISKKDFKKSVIDENNTNYNNITLSDGSILYNNSYNKSKIKRLKKFYNFGLGLKGVYNH